MTKPRRKRLFVIRRACHGMAAAMSLMFVTITAVLAVGLFAGASGNLMSSDRLSEASRAAAAADSGLRYFAWRIAEADMPVVPQGTIDADLAATLWPTIAANIVSELSSLTTADNQGVTYDSDTRTIRSGQIRLDGENSTFSVLIRPHPLDESDPLDARYVRISSTATSGEATRTVSVDFKIDKKIRYAVVSKTRIQIGRNTVIEGPVATTSTRTNPRDPLFLLSDFAHLNDALRNQVDAFYDFLEEYHGGYDNRIRAGTAEATLAADSGFYDVNADGWIDDFDLFTAFYDSDGDGAVSRAEFTNPSTGELYDENLFTAIDALNGPLYDGDVIRVGYNDGVLDKNDGYLKVRGQVSTTTGESVWANELANKGLTINDMIRGPIESDPGTAPVRFDADDDDLFDLSPTNFEAAAEGFRNRSGTNAGPTSRTPKSSSSSVVIVNPGGTSFHAGEIVTTAELSSANAQAIASGKPPATTNGTVAVIANTTLTAGDATTYSRWDSGETALSNVVERTPYGSTSYQATYKRPVFKRIHFKNVIIPKGLNALFDQCTFDGVTFVDTERNITKSTGSVTYSSGDGMSWSQRKISGDNFTKDKVLIGSGTPSSGQSLTHGSSKGNNIRFHNCTFKGPLANNYATAYTHFANSWEFTGSTVFKNETDQTATIVAPQTNIEMGSFTSPESAPSTLIGVVVAGNIDIRGTSVVDGSIIVTGDGAGNTTLSYFGPSDGDTDPQALPEGGFGRLTVRYNPHRALPDGINIAVELAPEPGSWKEGL